MDNMTEKPVDQVSTPLLLDGGMGRELWYRGIEVPATTWSAHALVVAPEVIREIHRDYIVTGADIITTNTYSTVRGDLAKDGLEDRFEELNRLACRLAIEARESTERPVLIAGSLPPLQGSYRPDLVGPFAQIEPLYREQAELLAESVDLILCETMSSAAESYAAAHAAVQTGKPVWVSWTLHEQEAGRLRSGESIEEAVAMLADLPVTGFLANCCPPEAIERAMPALVATGARFVGGYANTFLPAPPDWTLGEEGLRGLRHDLDPEAYVERTSAWLDAGAMVIGGCCGTRPAHIARLKRLIDERSR
jgi:S-methylmethionine-dependent homocysteine/selenocysteine methylase